MPNGTYGGVRGRKTKVGRKPLRFSSYSIAVLAMMPDKWSMYFRIFIKNRRGICEDISSAILVSWNKLFILSDNLSKFSVALGGQRKYDFLLYLTADLISLQSRCIYNR